MEELLVLKNQSAVYNIQDEISIQAMARMLRYRERIIKVLMRGFLRKQILFYDK